MVARLPRTAVIGGGVLGVSTAHQLARAGAEVVLMTEGELTSGASGRSLSWLNSAGVRTEAYHRLRMAGIDRYRTLAAHHRVSDWLRFGGGLSWTAAAESQRMRDWHRDEWARGYESHLLGADEVAARFGGVDPDAVPATGAVWNPGEGWVDLPSLVRFLIKDFVAHGGELVTGAGHCRVSVVSGRVNAVMTAAGDRCRVDAAVLATGAAVPAMAAELGVTIPDATPVSLLVGARPLRHDLTVVLNTPRVAVRPGLGGATRWTRIGPASTSSPTRQAATACRTTWSLRCWPKQPRCCLAILDSSPPGPGSVPSRFPATVTRCWVESRRYPVCRWPSPTAARLSA